MLQGEGIVELEDLDQESYLIIAEHDILERHAAFGPQGDPPVNAIMYYTFTIEHYRTSKIEGS